MARAKSRKTSNNSANIGFEQKLWLAADKLRSKMDAAEYDSDWFRKDDDAPLFGEIQTRVRDQRSKSFDAGRACGRRRAPSLQKPSLRERRLYRYAGFRANTLHVLGSPAPTPRIAQRQLRDLRK